VHFGDSVDPILGTFSGIYRLQANNDSKFNWKQENSTQGDIGEFGFCNGNKRWTFFLHGTDKCKDSIVISSPNADQFDPLRDAGSQWFVRERNLLVHPRIKMDLFTIAPICMMGGTDCDGQSINNTCELKPMSGSTVGSCKCDDQQTYGVRCEFSLANICLRLNIDSRFGVLPAARRLTSEEQQHAFNCGGHKMR